MYQANVARLVLPDSVTELSNGLGSLAGSLEHIRWSAGLTEIPAQAFYYFEKLETIDLPNTLTAVGDHAFAYSGRPGSPCRRA